MFQKLSLALLLIVSAPAFAGSDLVLPGERWEAKSIGYICEAYGEDVSAPLSHKEMNVQFETITTDYSLDNGLIKATFTENGEECRYSAILFADNAAATIRLIESKAYSTTSEASCQNGREVLDTQLADNDYQYWGHPHRLTILVPTEDAVQTCGEDSTHVGINFVVSRRLQ